MSNDGDAVPSAGRARSDVVTGGRLLHKDPKQGEKFRRFYRGDFRRCLADLALLTFKKERRITRCLDIWWFSWHEFNHIEELTPRLQLSKAVNLADLAGIKGARPCARMERTSKLWE
jgi:hypothetical protein